MPDYSQLKYDPFAPDTVRQLEQFEEFQFKISNKAKLCAYICLLYDPRSDFRKLYPDSLPERKYHCALAAGYKLTNGKFDKGIEDIFVGENDQVNDAILRFVRSFGIPDYPAHVTYTAILDKQFLAALKEKDERKLKIIQENIESARKMVTELEHRIFGGAETENVRASLYRLAERQRLNLRPEHKAQEIEEGKVSLDDPYYT